MSIDIRNWKPKSYIPKPEDEVRAVYSWGDGEHGQLGHREAYTREAIGASVRAMPPVKASYITPPAMMLIKITAKCTVMCHFNMHFLRHKQFSEIILP